MNWTTTWTIWLASVAVSFAVLEGIALYSKREGDTLSEVLRKWLGIDPPNRKRLIGIPAFLAVLIGFVAWFAPHIVAKWGWWDPWQ